MKKEYRYHPEIPGLKLNENGSEVLLNEIPVEVKLMSTKKHPYHYFYYKGYLISLAKAVLESWKGVSPERTLMPKHIDGNYNNYHYTNLQWGKRGGNGKFPSKINPQQEKIILERLANGESQTVIAKDYGVTRNAIFNLKKKHQQ